MTVVTPKFGMGASVLRLEDNRFLRGNGRYTDDIAPEACCMAMSCVRRSPRRRFSISIDAARDAPGVHLVLTGEDLAHLADVAVGRHAEAARRHPRSDARHPDPVPRPGAICRRRRGLRRG